MSRAEKILLKDLERIKKSPNDLFSVGNANNIFEWDIIVFGPAGTLYEHGVFVAKLTFSDSYPYTPPKFRFTRDMFHPNIDSNGLVCISILHNPGDDEYGYEHASERWMPTRSPESIIMSVISLLSNPNVNSPANMEATKMYRDDYVMYAKKVRNMAIKSVDYK